MRIKLFMSAMVLVILCNFCSTPQKKETRKTDFDIAYPLWVDYRYDSAFFYFNRYVNNPGDSVKKGSAYKYMGEIQWEIGDLYGAQQNLTIAINILNQGAKNHPEELSYAYNDLGNVDLDLKLYNESVKFYDTALIFSKGSAFALDVMNGKATALRKEQRYDNAIALYNKILSMKPVDQRLFARVIDNSAYTKWLQDSTADVSPELYAALKIRTDSQYTAGLNASYAHLSDYYAASNTDSALWYAQKMRLQATENKSPNDILEAIDKIIRLETSPAAKEQWYDRYKNLNDSLQFSRDTTRNRFAMIRYEVQKSRNDNLVLQQHISIQRLLTYGLIALIILTVTGLLSWFSKRRKRIRLDAEKQIQNDRLKTSQKVHDVVANGLYGIMNHLEHEKEIEKESIINKIEGLYEKSRNISYEGIKPAVNEAFNDQVHKLLTDFSDEQTKIFIVGNQNSFWAATTAIQQEQLKLVLHEILVNMKKHSKAENIVFEFKKEFNNAFIDYKDDGVGFKENIKFGNGLSSTVNRIKTLNGDINFGKSGKGGLSIAISFPLQSEKT